MAIETLELAANEDGTYSVACGLKDRLKVPATPNSLLWSLYDPEENIVNNRNGVNYETDKGNGEPGTLSTSMEIVLNGDDLGVSILGIGNTVSRYIKVTGAYDSDLGNGLPYTAAAKLTIVNLPGS